MVDASTQTETKCKCDASDDTVPQLNGGKWKDNLFVRYTLEPQSKNRSQTEPN